MDGAHFFVLLFCSTCRVIYYGRGSAEASQLPVSPSPDGECQPDSQHAHTETRTGRPLTRGTKRGESAYTHRVPVTLFPRTAVNLHTHTRAETHARARTQHEATHGDKKQQLQLSRHLSVLTRELATILFLLSPSFSEYYSL